MTIAIGVFSWVCNTKVPYLGIGGVFAVLHKVMHVPHDIETTLVVASELT